MTIDESIESKIIKTQDENGEIYSFELIDIVELDDKEYGLLIHINEEKESASSSDSSEESKESEEDEEEVVIMRLNKEDIGYVFQAIEDDDEFNRVIKFIEAEEDEEEDE